MKNIKNVDGSLDCEFGGGLKVFGVESSKGKRSSKKRMLESEIMGGMQTFVMIKPGCYVRVSS